MLQQMIGMMVARPESSSTSSALKRHKLAFVRSWAAALVTSWADRGEGAEVCVSMLRSSELLELRNHLLVDQP